MDVIKRLSPCAVFFGCKLYLSTCNYVKKQSNDQGLRRFSAFVAAELFKDGFSRNGKK